MSAIIVVVTVTLVWLQVSQRQPPTLQSQVAIPRTLHATTTQAFVDPLGQPVILKAMNLQPVWNGSSNSWTAADYTGIADQGFNAVRMVMFWKTMEPARAVFDAAAFAVLDTAVQRADDAGLRVILDPVHLYGLGTLPAWARTGDSVTSIRANAGPYLHYIAARYRDNPAVVAYDLVNEPARFPINQNGVLRMYNTLIAQVRTADPDKILLLEPTFGNSLIDPRFIDFSILRYRRNIVWSVHDYFAGGSADGFSPTTGIAKGTYLWNLKNGYAVPHPAELERHLLVQLDQLRKVGLPLWIGEFGIGPDAANRDEWIRDTVSLFNKYGLGYAWWEYWAPGGLTATDPNHGWYPWMSLVTG